MSHYLKLAIFKLLSLSVASFLFISHTYGQVDKDTLDNVEITTTHPSNAQKDVFSKGQENVRFDKKQLQFYKSSTLSKFLSQESTVFVKSYGVNNLATLSFRGASAAQSGLIWNGVPIVNPALGVADISLINNSIFDDFSIQYGGNAALSGSGSVGGALLLNSRSVDFRNYKSLSFSGQWGSYGNQHYNVLTTLNTEKLNIQLKGFYQYDLNNFNYEDEGQIKRMENAALQSAGSVGKIALNLNNRKKFSAFWISYDYWLQKYQRDIPRALFESASYKHQTDFTFRNVLLTHLTTKKEHTFELRSSWNVEQLIYNDSAIDLHTNNHYYYSFNEFLWKLPLNNLNKSIKQNLAINIPVHLAAIKGDNLKEQYTENRWAVVAMYQLAFWKERINFSANFRQEWQNGTRVPLLPQAGLELSAIKLHFANLQWSLSPRVTGGKTYRLPHLNELYYFPGGNKDLNPESGWNFETGYDAQSESLNQQNQFKISHSLTYFNRNIKNWIYWLGGSIWTPHNIADVWSRGIETRNALQLQTGTVIWYLKVNTAYTLSTTIQSLIPNDNSKGKQIPYTPRYAYQGNFGMEFKSLYTNINYHYTGYRFTTNDESAYLKPYSLWNLQLAYKFMWKNQNFNTNFQLNNLLNQSYFVVWGRPALKRNWQVGVSWNISQ